MKLLTPITLSLALLAGPALAYDGTNCKAPGNCWEPKPGYPEEIAGTQYDPQHDPAELSKQQESISAMDQRNAWRVHHMKQTGEFVYDVRQIPDYDENTSPPSP
jgi:methanol dehydrogenase (cytochrome c) subunit 2